MRTETLRQTIRQVLPAAIKEFNTVCLPHLSGFLGRSITVELDNEDQKTVEVAKIYARGINNAFFRHISKALPQYTEHTTDGSDYQFEDCLIEDKNSFSPHSGKWVGNGFPKCGTYLLKKFECDENGHIVKAFVAIVIQPKSKWTQKTLKTNRSTIEFKIEDRESIHVVYGDLKANIKNLKPILHAI